MLPKIICKHWYFFLVLIAIFSSCNSHKTVLEAFFAQAEEALTSYEKKNSNRM